MNKSCPLTPDLEGKILAAIRTGGFPHVAAEAFGVSPHTFKKWLRLGRNPKNTRYRTFAKNVKQAVATARLNAEMHTHQKDPKLWLRSGPGKETPASVGWTTFVRPQANNEGEIDYFASPAVLQFLALLEDALARFPEALQSVNLAITAWEKSRGRPTTTLLETAPKGTMQRLPSRSTR